MANYELVVGAGVIAILGLIVWAKVSRQTVKEVIVDIIDLLKGGGEEVEEKVGEITEYE